MLHITVIANEKKKVQGGVGVKKRKDKRVKGLQEGGKKERKGNERGARGWMEFWKEVKESMKRRFLTHQVP